jgi:hypothetical protein
LPANRSRKAFSYAIEQLPEFEPSFLNRQIKFDDNPTPSTPPNLDLDLAIRRGHWKYLDHPGSGGNRYLANSPLAPDLRPEAAPDAPGQLYNLQNDTGETQIPHNPASPTTGQAFYYLPPNSQLPGSVWKSLQENIISFLVIASRGATTEAVFARLLRT